VLLIVMVADALITIDSVRGFDVIPFWSVAVTAKLNVPAAVGVPDMTPLEDNVVLVGGVPDASAHT